MEHFIPEKCESCGAEYSSSDYDQNAEIWKCSNCKGFLRGGLNTPKEAIVTPSSVDFTQLKTYHKNPNTIFGILFSFKGRIPRLTYWFFIVLYVLTNSVFTAMWMESNNLTSTVFLSVYVVLSFNALIRVGSKRMHDTNGSGWFMLILLIPVINTLWLLTLGFLKGTSGDNSYGPDPLA